MTLKARGKKLVYVSEDIIDSIAEITKKRGESVTKFVEDMLRQAVKVDTLGFSPNDISEILEVIQVQRVLGGTFAPLEVLNYVSGPDYSPKRDQLQAKWYESGRLYGRYLKERSQSPVRALRALLRVMRWDLNEVTVREEEGVIKFRCVSTSLTIEGTAFLAKFVEGVVNGMGYKIILSEYLKGMIVMDLKAEA
jgi:hypothetical protein